MQLLVVHLADGAVAQDVRRKAYRIVGADHANRDATRVRRAGRVGHLKLDHTVGGEVRRARELAVRRQRDALRQHADRRPAIRLNAAERGHSVTIRAPDPGRGQRARDHVQADRRPGHDDKEIAARAQTTIVDGQLDLVAPFDGRRACKAACSTVDGDARRQSTPADRPRQCAGAAHCGEAYVVRDSERGQRQHRGEDAQLGTLDDQRVPRRAHVVRLVELVHQVVGIEGVDHVIHRGSNIGGHPYGVRAIVDGGDRHHRAEASERGVETWIEDRVERQVHGVFEVTGGVAVVLDRAVESKRLARCGRRRRDDVEHGEVGRRLAHLDLVGLQPGDVIRLVLLEHLARRVGDQAEVIHAGWQRGARRQRVLHANLLAGAQGHGADIGE